MVKLFDIAKFNNILKSHNQNIRAIGITSRSIILSNGLILDDETQVRLCKKRIMSGHAIWRQRFDDLYSTDIQTRQNTEKECRTVTSKNGGISCQKLHGEKIKNNLNIGIPWNKGLAGTYPYSFPKSTEAKQKISVANTGINNGMFGTLMSIEQKQYRSMMMKEKILNGQFTPNSNNRNTHWDSFYKNKKYRSSWEALYQYFDNDAEYESLRIQYNLNKKDYIYIIDFINHKTKTVIEVKPQELINDEKTQAKIFAVRCWCKEKNYTFLLADKSYFLSKSFPKELTDFDVKTQAKIRKLYETR